MTVQTAGSREAPPNHIFEFLNGLFLWMAIIALVMVGSFLYLGWMGSFDAMPLPAANDAAGWTAML